MSGHPELKPFFREAADVNGAEIPIWQNLNPYSDHWSFHLQGVTTCLMGDPVEAKRRGGRAYGHTVFDTVDKAYLRSQTECIANAEDWPGRHRSQEEIEGFVEKMGFRETVTLRGSVKEFLSARETELRPEPG